MCWASPPKPSNHPPPAAPRPIINSTPRRPLSHLSTPPNPWPSASPTPGDAEGQGFGGVERCDSGRRGVEFIIGRGAAGGGWFEGLGGEAQHIQGGFE